MNLRRIARWFFQPAQNLLSRAIDIESRLCGSYGCDIGVHIRRGSFAFQDLYVPASPRDGSDTSEDREVIGLQPYLQCVRDLAGRIATPDYHGSLHLPSNRLIHVYVATDQPYVVDLVKQVLESHRNDKFTVKVVWNDSDGGRRPDGDLIPAMMDLLISSRARVCHYHSKAEATFSLSILGCDWDTRVNFQ